MQPPESQNSSKLRVLQNLGAIVFFVHDFLLLDVSVLLLHVYLDEVVVYSNQIRKLFQH